jgi:hypothetical protein
VEIADGILGCRRNIIDTINGQEELIYTLEGVDHIGPHRRAILPARTIPQSVQSQSREPEGGRAGVPPVTGKGIKAIESGGWKHGVPSTESISFLQYGTKHCPSVSLDAYALTSESAALETP